MRRKAGFAETEVENRFTRGPHLPHTLVDIEGGRGGKLLAQRWREDESHWRTPPKRIRYSVLLILSNPERLFEIGELFGRPLELVAAQFQNVDVIGDLQGRTNLLIDQQNRQPVAVAQIHEHLVDLF